MNEEAKKEENKKERKWYAIHTYAGYEDAVLKYLKQRVEYSGMTDKIFDIIVPKEKKVKVRGGKRIEIEEKLYPGYVFVNMIMDNETWYIVRNTPRVSGFIGIEGKTPTPLSDEEVEVLLNKLSQKEPKHKIDFKIDEMVRIIDGPFKDYEGRIKEIDEERGKVKVLVPIFGRETMVELDALQVKKL